MDVRSEPHRPYMAWPFARQFSVTLVVCFRIAVCVSERRVRRHFCIRIAHLRFVSLDFISLCFFQFAHSRLIVSDIPFGGKVNRMEDVGTTRALTAMSFPMFWYLGWPESEWTENEEWWEKGGKNQMENRPNPIQFNIHSCMRVGLVKWC